MRRNSLDKFTDDLLKQKEAADKLSKMAGRASGLTAFLVRKSKEDVLREEAAKRLPELKENLIERKEFFDKKPIKSDNIRVLSKEIDKCENYISTINESTSIETLGTIMDWYYKTSEKYGF